MQRVKQNYRNMEIQTEFLLKPCPFVHVLFCVAWSDASSSIREPKMGLCIWPKAECYSQKNTFCPISPFHVFPWFNIIFS